MTVDRASTIELPAGFLDQERRLISPKDLLLLAALPTLAAVAWTCPDWRCLTLTRSLARLLRRLRPQRYHDYGRIFRDFFGEGMAQADLAAAEMEVAALQHLERLQLLRYYRPGRWHPRIEVAGQEHLERALARGKGAILWVAYSTFSDMISKVALHKQGHKVWHLSRPTHGHLSSTRFGVRYVNPIRVAVERRYLADRVILDPADSRPALARLEGLLADNQVVSITLSAQARRITLVPFGPGSLPLAAGAPHLADKSGAALLPLFVECRADGSFLVTIEPALQAPPGLSREQRITGMMVQQAALLYRYFQRLPAQYLNVSLHHLRRRCEALAQAGPRDGSTMP